MTAVAARSSETEVPIDVELTAHRVGSHYMHVSDKHCTSMPSLVADEAADIWV